VKRCWLALLFVVLAGTPAFAQMADALGKPLPSADLPAGSVSVRVVAGSPSSPVTSTEVTLFVAGAPRLARTDAAGRAHFKDLPAGALVQAMVADEDKREIRSDEFALPADGGVRLMLSTRPWVGGASGGAPRAPGGMPNPRQMSGEPRPEQNDPAGTYTVRLAYDDFTEVPIAWPVALVGYAADDRVELRIADTDMEGRAQFTGLDRTGATSYFALALLSRNGATDRLMTMPAALDSRFGIRAILSSDKRRSTAPAIDDLSRLEKQDGAPPAGKIRITLEGGFEMGAVVSLVELTPDGPRPFARGKPQLAPPDPSDIQASAQFSAKSDLPAGTFEVQVQGGPSGGRQPLEGVSIEVYPVADWQTRTGGTLARTTEAGSARIVLDPTAQTEYVAIVTINGNPLTSKPFDLSRSGGRLDVEANWDARGKPEVEFDVVPRPGQVFFAETRMHGQLYRTLPFQPVPERGTRATLFVFPRVLFSFSLTSRIDDQYFGVSGRFEVSNNSWAPFVGGSDGLVIPLPKGFTGGLVADKDQGDVAVAPGEGFRISRPIPPGSKQFHGAFSLPVKRGKVTWSLDLPFGAFNSGMEILSVPGMSVRTPPNVTGQTMTVPQGTFYVLPQISILPRQAMVMSISGLPKKPAWRVWPPRILGLVAIVMVLAGVAFALTRKRDDEAHAAARAARRARLLDELVALEKAGKNPERREQLVTELEELWDDAERGDERPAG
jgi:hypothetical protein